MRATRLALPRGMRLSRGTSLIASAVQSADCWRLAERLGETESPAGERVGLAVGGIVRLRYLSCLLSDGGLSFLSP
jgi:hypothetical protein